MIFKQLWTCLAFLYWLQNIFHNIFCEFIHVWYNIFSNLLKNQSIQLRIKVGYSYFYKSIEYMQMLYTNYCNKNRILLIILLLQLQLSKDLES